MRKNLNERNKSRLARSSSKLVNYSLKHVYVQHNCLLRRGKNSVVNQVTQQTRWDEIKFLGEKIRTENRAHGQTGSTDRAVIGFHASLIRRPRSAMIRVDSGWSWFPATTMLYCSPASAFWGFELHTQCVVRVCSCLIGTCLDDGYLYSGTAIEFEMICGNIWSMLWIHSVADHCTQ